MNKENIIPYIVILMFSIILAVLIVNVVFAFGNEFKYNNEKYNSYYTIEFGLMSANVQGHELAEYCFYAYYDKDFMSFDLDNDFICNKKGEPSRRQAESFLKDRAFFNRGKVIITQKLEGGMKK